MRLTDELRKALRVRVDYTNMTDKYLGDKGISQKTLDAHKKLAKAAHAFVANNRGRDELFMGWTELPYNQDEIVADILEEAKKIRRNFDNFVVLGIGGSALGPIMAFNALCHLHYNDLPKSKRRGPKFYVEDNVDPVRMKELLDVIDIKKTCFNVISKSGATSETMTQYLIIADLLEKAGENVKDHVVFTTDAVRGNLVKISKELGGVKSYVLPDGVGTFPRGASARGGPRHRHQAALEGRRLYGQAVQDGGPQKEPRAPLRDASIHCDERRQEHRRFDAVLR